MTSEPALIERLTLGLWPVWLLLFFLVLLPFYFIFPWASFFYPPAWVNVPFQAGAKGATAEVEFDATLAKTYVFYLNLHYKRGDGQDQERVSQQVDSWSASLNGKSARRAPPLPVHLTLSRLTTGASTVLDRTFVQHRLDGHGVDYFAEVITSVHLEPSHYRARIEALEDVPALQTIPVHFDVHVPGHPNGF
jgi:hypothetical protein